MKHLFLLLFLVNLCNAEIIPSTSKITWSPGVRGGIPEQTERYTSLSSLATTDEILSALNNCPSNKHVYLQAGTYSITKDIKIPNGVVLKGAGIDKTILVGQKWVNATDNGNLIRRFFFMGNSSFNYEWNTYPAKDLVSCEKGSVNLNTSAAHGWSVGDYLIVDTKTNEGRLLPVSNFSGPSSWNPTNAAGYGTVGNFYATWLGREAGTRPKGQMVLVTNVVDSDTVQVNPELYFSFTNTPQAVKIGPMSFRSGIEDLTINNLTSNSRDVFEILGLVNGWIKNVKVIGIRRRTAWVYNGMWLEFRGMHILGSTDALVPPGEDRDPIFTSDRAYPIFFGPHATACLVEDNISERLTIGGVCWEGNASGNVFSYNFMTNIFWRHYEPNPATGDPGSSDLPRRANMLMHGGHPIMNLMEGNYSSGGARADEYWGTSSHFTYLRNRISSFDRGTDLPPSQSMTMDIERRNQYYSFVGNILGGSGAISPGVNETIYEWSNLDYSSYISVRTALWKIGYMVNGTGTTERDIIDYDINVLNTMVRWGNWSFRTNDTKSGSGIVWDSRNVVHSYDTDIPKSYYLNKKPAFFGELEWPPYDPNRPEKNQATRIPAGYRYYYGTNPPGIIPEASYPNPIIMKRETGPGSKDRLDF